MSTALTTPSRERSALAWALAAILLWGTLAAVVGDALRGVPATTLVLLAFLFGAPTLVALDLARGRTLGQVFRAPWPVVALGAWGIFGYHAAFFVALERAPIVQANLLNYLWPLLMVLLAPVLTGEKLTRGMLAGAVTGFLGAALVVTQGKTLAVSGEHALGYGLALLAALAWSSFSVLLKRLGPAGEDRMALWVTLSVPPALLLAGLTGGLVLPSPGAVVAAAWLGVGPMALAFFCWNRALSRGSAARIGTLSYLDPLLSTLAVAWALRQPLGWASWTGMALIVGGAAWPAWRRRG